MDSLYIVMPAYNEEDTIENVVREWYPIIQDKPDASKLIIADSGSTDKTHQILIDLKNELPKLEILDNSNHQHGPKVISLYQKAINDNIDFVFQTDSDGQTSPSEFESFWIERDRYDAIIGNRTRRGDGISRAIVEKVVCLLLKLYFGTNIPDANAPYRLMKTDLVKKYITKLPSNYNLPNIMMTAYFSYYQEAIKFKEISFKPRQGGTNSINIKKIVKIGYKALGDFKQFKKEI